MNRPDIARDMNTHEVIIQGTTLQASCKEDAIFICELLTDMREELARFRAWRDHVERLTRDIERTAPRAGR